MHHLPATHNSALGLCRLLVAWETLNIFPYFFTGSVLAFGSQLPKNVQRGSSMNFDLKISLKVLDF